MADRFRHIAVRTASVAGIALVAAALGFGWHVAQNVQLTRVELSGYEHEDAELLMELLALPDSSRIFDLEPRILADRVQRAPWVRRARVRRWLNGTLRVSVEERTPAALAIDGSGRPVAFLDREGFPMPLTPSALRAGHDLPLITGHLPRLLPTQPIDDPAVRALLAELPPPGSFGDALISSIERTTRGELVLVTAPAPGGAALRVDLGRDGFATKIRRLEAFWEQVVLARAEAGIRRVDLRFDGQIVTDEQPPAPPASPNPSTHE